MHKKFEEIQNIIKANFNLNELKLILYKYLSKMEDGYRITKIDDDYELLVYDATSQKNELYKISSDCDLMIIEYKALYEYDIDFYYHVRVTVGCSENKNSQFTSDKCILTLKFNDDLSLYDVEFSVGKFHAKEDE